MNDKPDREPLPLSTLLAVTIFLGGLLAGLIMVQAPAWVWVPFAGAITAVLILATAGGVRRG